jgi:glycosyltransferase involved in cell wall biosynthesis
MKPQLLVDARCLQQPDFAWRGIGLHLATMLSSRQAADFAITMLLDPALPPPEPDLAALADAATTTAYAASRSHGVFLQPAPFAASPGAVRRLLNVPHRRSIAVVLDFIPCEHPQTYLATPQLRRRYAAQAAALRKYERFLPISRATEQRLHHYIPASIGRSDVTGVAIRLGLLPMAPPPPFAARSGVVVVSGDDPRKNPAVAVRAGLGVPIRYVGLHDHAMRASLEAIHQAAGGVAEHLMFLPPLTDAELAATYAGALLVIAPSRAEGFSMPVIEAIAQSTPVLAADEPAQAELLAPDDLFPADDAMALHAKAMARLTDATCWHAAQARQAAIAAEFSQDAVATRFWAPIASLAQRPQTTSRRDAKPRIAFLSPLPPATSGCADHSASLLAALAPLASITAFSDTIDPILPAGIGFGGPADAGVMRSATYDAIITILGNSPFHATETRLLLDYGAAAIVHDARLTGFYRGTWGDARALGVASAERGADVSLAELDAWDSDEVHMPVRMLGEVAAAAAPLIVHAADTAGFIAARHGIDSIAIEFAPYRVPDDADLTAQARRHARIRLGVPDDAALIASFGHVHTAKEPGAVIEAFGLIAPTRACRFAMVGSGNPTLVASLRDRATSLGIAPDTLDLDAELVAEARYRDYLLAADVAVQLRRAPPGSISGALADAIAAGLPCVAAATLVEAIVPPAYVTAVADDADPEAIAAAIIAVLDRGRAEIPAQRAAFMQARSMARYARAVLDAVLGSPTQTAFTRAS